MPGLPPAALIFDMDGLLVDSEPLWLQVVQAFCRARGFTWTKEHHAGCVGGGLRATLSATSERFGFAVDPERDIAALLDDFIGSVGGLALKPGAAELLSAAALAGLPTALASSSPHRLIAAVLERFALRPRFQAVVSGDDVAHPKPAPDIFLRAAAELGVPPARCAVLEDSLAGVTAGRAAGMVVVAVPEGPWEGRGFEALAAVCLPSLEHAHRWLGIAAPAAATAAGDP
ncbi:HAD family phosphatase [Sorangium sp. So ce119]|uniref:HAD family hydrolase n=1 Tax=Sorangium sp. So ce119 TaxID=3133279 RepID=UPI003F633B1C